MVYFNLIFTTIKCLSILDLVEISKDSQNINENKDVNEKSKIIIEYYDKEILFDGWLYLKLGIIENLYKNNYKDIIVRQILNIKNQNPTLPKEFLPNPKNYIFDKMQFTKILEKYKNSNDDLIILATMLLVLEKKIELFNSSEFCNNEDCEIHNLMNNSPEAAKNKSVSNPTDIVPKIYLEYFPRDQELYKIYCKSLNIANRETNHINFIICAFKAFIFKYIDNNDRFDIFYKNYLEIIDIANDVKNMMLEAKDGELKVFNDTSQNEFINIPEKFIRQISYFPSLISDEKVNQKEDDFYNVLYLFFHLILWDPNNLTYINSGSQSLDKIFSSFLTFEQFKKEIKSNINIEKNLKTKDNTQKNTTEYDDGNNKVLFIRNLYKILKSLYLIKEDKVDFNNKNDIFDEFNHMVNIVKVVLQKVSNFKFSFKEKYENFNFIFIIEKIHQYEYLNLIFHMEFKDHKIEINNISLPKLLVDQNSKFYKKYFLLFDAVIKNLQNSLKNSAHCVLKPKKNKAGEDIVEYMVFQNYGHKNKAFANFINNEAGFKDNHFVIIKSAIDFLKNKNNKVPMLYYEYFYPILNIIDKNFYGQIEVNKKNSNSDLNYKVDVIFSYENELTLDFNDFLPKELYKSDAYKIAESIWISSLETKFNPTIGLNSYVEIFYDNIFIIYFHSYISGMCSDFKKICNLFSSKNDMIDESNKLLYIKVLKKHLFIISMMYMHKIKNCDFSKSKYLNPLVTKEFNELVFNMYLGYFFRCNYIFKTYLRINIAGLLLFFHKTSLIMKDEVNLLKHQYYVLKDYNIIEESENVSYYRNVIVKKIFLVDLNLDKTILIIDLINEYQPDILKNTQFNNLFLQKLKSTQLKKDSNIDFLLIAIHLFKIDANIEMNPKNIKIFKSYIVNAVSSLSLAQKKQILKYVGNNNKVKEILKLLEIDSITKLF